MTNAAILNLDFNLFDKIISFTVLHILQTFNVLELCLLSVCSQTATTFRKLEFVRCLKLRKHHNISETGNFPVPTLKVGKATAELGQTEITVLRL